MAILEGKAVMITGAASGIGEATAKEAAAEGAKLLLCDLDAEKGAAVAAAIGEAASFHHCDVTDEAAVEAAVTATISAQYADSRPTVRFLAFLRWLTARILSSTTGIPRVKSFGVGTRPRNHRVKTPAVVGNGVPSNRAMTRSILSSCSRLAKGVSCRNQHFCS